MAKESNVSLLNSGGSGATGGSHGQDEGQINVTCFVSTICEVLNGSVYNTTHVFALRFINSYVSINIYFFNIHSC